MEHCCDKRKTHQPQFFPLRLNNITFYRNRKHAHVVGYLNIEYQNFFFSFKNGCLTRLTASVIEKCSLCCFIFLCTYKI